MMNRLSQAKMNIKLFAYSKMKLYLQYSLNDMFLGTRMLPVNTYPNNMKISQRMCFQMAEVKFFCIFILEFDLR